MYMYTYHYICANVYIFFSINRISFTIPDMLLAYRTSVMKCANVSVPGVPCTAKLYHSYDILGWHAMYIALFTY